MTKAKMEKKKRPCVVCALAHADDVELCCGGVLAKYIAQGWRGIYGVLSLCNSGWSFENGRGVYRPSKEIVPLRRREAKAAAKVFGAEFFAMDFMENVFTNSKGELVPLTFPKRGFKGEEPPWGDLPLSSAAGAGSSDASPKAIRPLVDLLIEARPDIVIGQTVDNSNPDHFCAALILRKAYVMASEKVSMGPLYVCHSERPFFPMNPDWIADITGYEAVVEKAIACHVSQNGPNRPPAMRKFWGHWGKFIHAKSAEPFVRIL